jgi:hypothetical protein
MKRVDRRRRFLVMLGAITACSGAGEGTSPAPVAAKEIRLSLSLPSLDSAREGGYEAWVVDASGTSYSLGRFTAAWAGARTFTSPIANPRALKITLELPKDFDASPSEQVLLQGTIAGTLSELTYAGAITQGGLALREAPGQFTMFTPSNNDSLGYPSIEEAGVWLFNMSPAQTAQKDYYVRLTQLQKGWTYEGWMVRDIGQPTAIWLSYGKFLPDWTGAVNQPDDTGWGPFSGVLDFRRARLEDFPGDDWLSNPLNFPWKWDLTLPLDLREKDARGLRWTHVITIEPATDKGEPITTERPFFMRPYIDLFGDLGPGVARTITPHFESMPRGTAEVR